MSDDPPAPSPAVEHRLDELLGLLAADQPPPDPAFAGVVVRRARIQRAIVTPLRTVGTLVAAVGEGIRLVLGVRPQDRDR
jgi:hypothetical protein